MLRQMVCAKHRRQDTVPASSQKWRVRSRHLGHTRPMRRDAVSPDRLQWRDHGAQGLLARALLAASLALCLPVTAQEAPPHRVFVAGPYSFSDELGGFTILSASGIGTRADPVVITQELYSSTPVTMTIRTVRPIRAFDTSGKYANGMIAMRIVSHNASGQGWVEFEFELQEIRHVPSTFGDGLSFDQRSENKEMISSDSFAFFSRDFEPYDKLLFTRGKVDPGQTAGFSFVITDFTPRWEFFLVQDPRIPSS